MKFAYADPPYIRQAKKQAVYAKIDNKPVWLSIPIKGFNIKLSFVQIKKYVNVAQVESYICELNNKRVYRMSGYLYLDSKLKIIIGMGWTSNDAEEDFITRTNYILNHDPYAFGIRKKLGILDSDYIISDYVKMINDVTDVD